MNKITLRRGGFGLRVSLTLGVLGLAAGAFAQTPDVNASPPAVPFSRAALLLAERKSLAADFVITTTYATPYLDTKETGRTFLARPNRVRIEIDRHRRVKDGDPWEPTGNGSVTVSDGKQAWNVTTHPKSSQYETQPVSEAWLASAVGPLSPVSAFFTNAPLVTGGAATWEKQTTDGETFDVATAKTAEETQTYYFDADGFLRRIVTERPLNTGIAATAGARANFTRRDVRLSKFAALSESAAAARFAYAPPADSVRMESPRRARLSSADGAKTIGVGDVAPDIVAEDVNGNIVKLSDFTGKPVLVKFWATWCWPCRQSLPETEALAKENGGAVTVLAVALWDSRKSFRDFVTKYAADRHTTPDKLPIRFVFDSRPMGQDAASSLYGIKATPTHIIIDKEGKIASVTSGYSGPSPRLSKAVKAVAAVR